MESCVSVRRDKVWKDSMEWIMKEENDWIIMCKEIQ